MSSKHNYIVLGSDWELYRLAYSDILGMSNVKYVGEAISNPILNRIYRLHLNPGINSVIPLPGKSWWHRFYCDARFDDDGELCFLLFSNWYRQNNGVIPYIRKHYPNAKVVVFFQDLIKKATMTYTNAPVDVERLKAEADLVITFDFAEAEAYGIAYHNIPYSVPDKPVVGESGKQADVYFLGQAKDRLDEIMDVFYSLKKCGLTLNFILANVPIHRRIVSDEIRYIDGLTLSYEENLQNVANARCLLEIMQHGGSGYTSRTLEAIVHDRRLLTNNPLIKDAPFYTPELVSYFDKPENIESEFVKRIKAGGAANYNYKENLSPKELLAFIERHI